MDTFECKQCSHRITGDKFTRLRKANRVAECPRCGCTHFSHRLAEEPVCDFCSAPNPTWAFPARSFSEHTDPNLTWVSRGGWAACEPCKQMIQRGDREGLAMRSAKRYKRKHPDFEVGLLDLARTVRKAHDNFWAAREGPPVKEET